MFEKSAAKQSKSKMLVHFETSNKKVLEGEIDLPQTMSFVEFMNSERPFVEVETLPNETRLVAKNSIVEAREVMRGPNEKGSPYAILRIQSDATFQEVKDAWKTRVKACHPDRVSSLGVDEEIEYAARRATQKINMAYDEIVGHMREKAKAKKAAAAASDEPTFSVYF